MQADAYVVDERTMRLLIENPKSLKRLLENKLHCNVTMDNKLVKGFKDMIKDIKVIRSIELVTIAYEKGLLNKFITNHVTPADLLDGLLWGLRLRGCSISNEEIDDLMKFEINRR